MGKINKAQKAKLVVGFIYTDLSVLDEVILHLKKKYGSIDYKSEKLDFKCTDYYTQEMGEGLKRHFISFERLIFQERLADIKVFTNKIEEKFSFCNRRKINIDPGIIMLGKLILATTKDYAHRIYVGRGIFAEVTLRYQNKTFTPLDWTYPDYQSQECISIFKQIRQAYKRQIDGT